MKRITIKEAEKQGYMVDTTCYPHIGYKGTRFHPVSTVEVYTELESNLLHFKETVIGLWVTDKPDLLSDEEKAKCFMFELTD